jgi:hypothetical protein
VQIAEHVEAAAFAARSGEPLQHLEPVDGTVRHVGIARDARVMRHGQPSPGVDRGQVGVAFFLQEPAARQRSYFRAAEALEQSDTAIPMRASCRFGADEHQF